VARIPGPGWGLRVVSHSFVPLSENSTGWVTHNEEICLARGSGGWGVHNPGVASAVLFLGGWNHMGMGVGERVRALNSSFIRTPLVL
jgi:hypothetical protein